MLLLFRSRVIGNLDSVFCCVKSPSITGSIDSRPKSYAVANPLLVLPEYIITVEYKVCVHVCMYVNNNGLGIFPKATF